MTKTILDGNYREGLTLFGTKNYELTAQATMETDGNGFDLFLKRTNFVVAGVIDCGQDAIAVSGDGCSVHVENTGAVVGNFGINVQADNVVIINDGRLIAAAYGISVIGDNAKITNGGTIFSNVAAVVLASGHGHVVNEKGGVIVGGVHTSGTMTVVNDGIIRGEHADDQGVLQDSKAISGGDGSDRIVNHGTISGTFDLGAGDDVVDTRGGTLQMISGGPSEVDGGSGNDTLITDNASYGLTEEADNGTDRVKSTVSYTLSANVENLQLLGKGNTKGTGNELGNVLEGNSGKNILSGGDGYDELHGGKGNDRLIGGGASDTFVFQTGDGHDTVADFETIDEHIDVSKWKPAHNFEDVMSHAKNEQGGVLITFGEDSLFLDGLQKSELQERHFIF
jgi:Ca2+-binding RTX toxin-like protein